MERIIQLENGDYIDLESILSITNLMPVNGWYSFFIYMKLHKEPLEIRTAPVKHCIEELHDTRKKLIDKWKEWVEGQSN